MEDYEEVGKKENKQILKLQTERRRRKKGERMYINWAIRKPENDGWPTTFFYTDKVKNEDGDRDIEFWNKIPTVFKRSSDDLGRIIFHAGSRANYIYDLQLLKGEVRIWSEKDVRSGNAFGLQKRPFVQDIDFIDHNFVSVLTKDKLF